MSTVGMALPLGPPDHDVAAVGTGHRALHHEYVILGVHFDDLEVAHSHLRRAHMAAHAHTRQHTRREAGCADRSGRPVEHGAVGGLAASEMMALHHACETAAF